jgi:hypothetical protein
MPVPGNGVRAGSVPLDALDAEEIADLLGCAALVAGALAGEPAAEAACAGQCGDWQDLAGLHAGTGDRRRRPGRRDRRAHRHPVLLTVRKASRPHAHLDN